MSGQYTVEKGFTVTWILQTLDDTWGRKLWKTLAKKLDVPPTTIEKLHFNLYREKVSYRDVIEDVLLDWFYRNKSEATYDNFIAIIRQHNELKNIERKQEFPLDLSPNLTLEKGWKDLETSVKGELLSKEVLVCGERKRLIQVAGNMSAETFTDILQKTVHGQLLTDLMTTQNIVVIKSMIPQCVPWYIPRTMMARTLVHPQILMKECDEIFLLKGIEWSTLSFLSGFQPSDTSDRQLCTLNVHHIILQCDSHFEKICTKTEKPVHVLEYKEGKLSWEKSRGNCNTILLFLSGEYENMEETDFVNRHFANHNSSTICICDYPRSGKSELLASLARKVQNKYTERLVIFFYTPEILRLLRDSKTLTFDPDFIKELIAKELSSNDLGYHILIHAFSSSCYQIEFFLDAIDDLYTDDDIKVCCELIKCIRCFENVRLCITTGNKLTIDTINLEAFIYRIKPFSQSEQIKFLSNFWTCSFNAEQNFALSSFARDCINSIKNCDQKTIAAIPLQCLMLGDIYSRNAKQISYLGLYRRNEIERQFTLFELYKYYMNMRFVYLEVQEELCHTIDLLFPTISSLLFQSSKSQKRRRYSHKTFAEYAIAKSILNLISILSDIEIQKDSTIDKNYNYVYKVLQLVFKTSENGNFVYSSLGYFLNEMIQDTRILEKYNVHTNMLRVLYKETFGSKELKLCFMKACSLNQFYGMYCLFLGNAQEVFVKGSLTLSEWKKMLLISTKYSNFSFVKNVLELLNCVGDINILQVEFNEWKLFGIELTPLHIAAQRGCLQTFELFANLYETRLRTMKSLAHVCVHDTICDKEEIVQNKIQILKLILQIFGKFGTQIVDYEIENKYTPLLMDRVHIKLIKLLLANGANPYSHCSNLYTFAHKAALHMDPLMFHELVEYIVQKQYDQIFRYKNYKDESPFDIATKQIRLQLSTIDLLSSSLAGTLDHELVYRDNFLYHLINNYFKSSELRLALRYTSGWISFKYKDSSTSLLHVAVEAGNVEALSFLLSMGADPNVVDHTGKTPLHIACFQQGKSKRPAVIMSEIVKILIDNGADVNITDREGIQPLTFILDTF